MIHSLATVQDPNESVPLIDVNNTVDSTQTTFPEHLEPMLKDAMANLDAQSADKVKKNITQMQTFL